MPLEPATNAILIEATKTLQGKSEGDRSEFERHIFARLGELKTLIERGNTTIERYTGVLQEARNQTLKACGAYENTADMLAVYYVQKRQEGMVKEQRQDEANKSEMADALKAGGELAQELLREAETSPSASSEDDQTDSQPPN